MNKIVVGEQQQTKIQLDTKALECVGAFEAKDIETRLANPGRSSTYTPCGIVESPPPPYPIHPKWNEGPRLGTLGEKENK